MRRYFGDNQLFVALTPWGVLFHRNVVISCQLNISCRDSFIASKFQCFRITLLMFGKSDCKLMLVEYTFVSAFP